MKILKINPREIRITPTDKKFKKAKEFFNKLGDSGLPKEEPLERRVYISTGADEFQKIKNSINISIEKMQETK